MAVSSKSDVYVNIHTDTKTSLKSLAAYAAAITAAAMVVKKLIKVAGELEAAFAVQEMAEAKLNAALRATSYQVGITHREMMRMAQDMQRRTLFGDEQAANAMALMVTFKEIGGEIFPQAMEAAADMAAMLGTDLNSAVMQLGKALNDPVTGLTALRRSGISFTQAQQDTIKALVESGRAAEAQRIILAELESQVGGTAEAMARTASGAAVQLKNAMGDLKESFGRLISESLEPSRRSWTLWVEAATKAVDQMRAVSGIRMGAVVDPTLAAGARIQELKIQQEDYAKALEWTEERLKDFHSAGNLVRVGATALLDVFKATFPAIFGKFSGLILITEKNYKDFNEKLKNNIVLIEEEIEGLEALISTTKNVTVATQEMTEADIAVMKIRNDLITTMLQIKRTEEDLQGAHDGTEKRQRAVMDALEKLNSQQYRQVKNVRWLIDNYGEWLPKIIKVESAVRHYADAWVDYQVSLKQAMAEEVIGQYTMRATGKVLEENKTIIEQISATVKKYGEDYIKTALDIEAQTQSMLKAIGTGFADLAMAVGTSFKDIDAGADAAKEAFKSMAVAVLKMAAEIATALALQNAILAIGTLNPLAALKAGAWTAAAASAYGVAGYVQALGDGGIVTRPTLALVGESGPEAVVPLGRGGGMGTVVNIYPGMLVHERDIESMIGGIARRVS